MLMSSVTIGRPSLRDAGHRVEQRSPVAGWGVGGCALARGANAVTAVSAPTITSSEPAEPGGTVLWRIRWRCPAGLVGEFRGTTLLVASSPPMPWADGPGSGLSPYLP